MPKKKAKTGEATLFKASLLHAGIAHEVEGEMLFDALSKLDPQQVKLKGILRVTKGDKAVERLFYRKALRRVLGNKSARLLWATRLEYLLSLQ